MKTLDLETWPRRDHFEYFRHFDNPYFNVCVDVDVSDLKEYCSGPGGPSFFAALLYLSQLAVHRVEQLRYRIHGKEVVIHDKVACGSTILRDDETFAYGYFDYADNFADFAAQVAQVSDKLRRGGRLEPKVGEDDLTHYSSLPWISFTSFSHARRWNTEDSIPKIMFGKYRLREGKWQLPVSIEVHHALVDGLHVGRYYAALEEFLGSLQVLES